MSNDNLRISHKVLALIGIGLIAPSEKKYENVGNNIVSIVFIALSIMLLFGQTLNFQFKDVDLVQELIDWLVWLSLFSCYAVMMYLVNNTKLFLKENWLMPFVLIIGVALLVRDNIVFDFFTPAHSLLAVVVFLPAINFLVRFFLDGQLWTTLVAALVIVVFFGLLVANFDPNIHSAQDGVWWALATVSTVGYGDVVPSSLVGRMIGGILVVVGLGLFVVITANFLSIMLRSEARGVGHNDGLRDTISELRSNQEKIRKALKKLQSEVEDLK